MNWIVLKALHELYVSQKVNKNDTLAKSGEVRYLIDPLQILEEQSKVLSALEGFNEFYQKHYLQNYEHYYQFLTAQGLLKPQTRLEERDIITLMHIKALRDAGDLEELRKQIIEIDESVRGVSQMFFKNDKYLDDKPSLIEALKVILEVAHFSNEKDQQYIYKLECDEPQCIVLCENLDFLTKPNKPRKHHIELWYAGGKNVAKLKYADPRGLPIYYSCDWDYDGLLIIYPLVKEKLPAIQLLRPNGPFKSISETEHASKWDSLYKLDELNNFFDPAEFRLINDLIAKDSWIIEESNDLIGMLV